MNRPEAGRASAIMRRMSGVRPSITTIVFDFDGVLADTERLHLRAFQEVFAARGWSLDETAYFDQYLGYDDRGLVLAFGEDQRLGLTSRDVQTLVTDKGKVFASAEGIQQFAVIIFVQTDGKCIDGKVAAILVIF